MTATTRLVVDCAVSGLSLALQNMATGQVFSHTSTQFRGSDALPTQLDEVFKQSGTGAAHIATIGVTVGPGSFTGSRLGLAAAEALKLTNPAIQIIGLSTLQALALQMVAEHAPQKPFTILLDAAGGQAYAQTFTPQAQPVDDARCLPLAQAAALPAPLFAQTGLMLPPPAQAFTTLHPQFMLDSLSVAAYCLPPHPVYLKPLTYRRADA